MTPEPPRTYKHQLTADEFKFAFTATEAEFAERADEMREKGVERLTTTEIWGRYSIKMTYSDQKTVHTIILDTEVALEQNLSIIIENIQHPIPTIIILKSVINGSLSLSTCKLAKTEGTMLLHEDATCFYLIESRLDNLNISNSTLGNFFIIQSWVNDLDINHNSIIGDFTFYQQSAIGNFSVSKSSIEYFTVEESTLKNIAISQGLTKDLSISNSKTGSLSIRRKSIIGDIEVIKQSTTNFFSISESVTGNFNISRSTTGNFNIRKKSLTGNFDILRSEILSFYAEDLFFSLNLSRVNINIFKLNNCRITKIRVASGCRIECYISLSEINLIDLQQLTLSKESVVSLFDCNVYACLIEEFVLLGSLFFRQIKKANEPFTWYDSVARSEGNEHRLMLLKEQTENYEEEKIKLTNELKINQPTFRIVQSSLGKTEFTNCDLGGFRFEFNNAKITEVFMSGGTVPEEYIDSSDDRNVIIYGETKYTLAWHEQKVSLYNQLKKIFDGQGDVYRSTYFNALTAKHQQRTLQIRRGVQYKEQKPWPGRTWKWVRGYVRPKLPTDLTLDALTFKLNQYSNLHGESWGRALLFTLVVSIPIYVLFLASAGLIVPNAPIDWNLVGAYFSFIDPTHRLDFLTNVDGHDDLTLTGWSSPVDFLGRIVVGYGIYQFISAFRKHGKK